MLILLNARYPSSPQLPSLTVYSPTPQTNLSNNMKAVFFAVAALAASVIASPIAAVQPASNDIQKRQLEQPAAIISALRDAVVAQTGPISKLPPLNSPGTVLEGRD